MRPLFIDDYLKPNSILAPEHGWVANAIAEGRWNTSNIHRVVSYCPDRFVILIDKRGKEKQYPLRFMKDKEKFCQDYTYLRPMADSDWICNSKVSTYSITIDGDYIGRNGKFYNFLVISGREVRLRYKNFGLRLTYISKQQIKDIDMFKKSYEVIEEVKYGFWYFQVKETFSNDVKMKDLTPEIKKRAIKFMRFLQIHCSTEFNKNMEVYQKKQPLIQLV